MRINTSSKINIQGVALEILQLQPRQGPSEDATLVFLHEGLGSVSMWRDWPARVCDQLGCAGLVYSRQGYGHSDPVQNVQGPSIQIAGQRQGRLLPDYMHREALEILPQLLQALNIQRPVLIGHSDGGTIALIHASRMDVAGCVVMAPHVMVEDMSIRAITAARHEYEQGTLRQRLGPYHADVDCAFWQWNDVWLSEGFRSFDIRSELSSISAPLLLIQGEDDPYGTMAQIDVVAQTVTHAKVLKLSDCGHSPHRDQPQAVIVAVQDLIQSLLVLPSTSTTNTLAEQVGHGMRKL